MAETGDGFEGRVETCAAHGIVNDIEATAAGMAFHISLDALRAVDRRRAEASDEAALGRAVHAVDIGPQRHGKLDNDVTNATAGSEHKHFLAGLHLRAVDQAFPGGDEDQWQSRGLPHREIGWFKRQQPGVCHLVRCKRALHAADAARHAIDFITEAKAGDIRANRFDHPRHVNAQHGRKRLPGMAGGTRSNLGVERVHTAGPDADKNLASLRLGAGQLRKPEIRACTVENKGFHQGHDGSPK
jgi:hypothetical protein